MLLPKLVGLNVHLEFDWKALLLHHPLVKLEMIPVEMDDGVLGAVFCPSKPIRDDGSTKPSPC